MWVALLGIACGLQVRFFEGPTGAGPARIVVTLTVRSAFTSAGDVPPSWLEVLIFGKDPATLEFFEQPRVRLIHERQHVVELTTSDFPASRLWLLYRFDESAAEQARAADADKRRLYETHKDSTWVFVVPVTADLKEISINGANLTYAPAGPAGGRNVAGAAFSAALPRYGGSRKGGQGYVRIDHLPQVSFADAASDINKGLPTSVRLDPGNSRIWPGDAALRVAPETLGGRPYFGPKEHDKAAVERGYVPVFFVLSNIAREVALRRDKPWAMVDPARGELLTDPARQDPDLWAQLSAQAQDRYRVPARIAPGGEGRVVALWKRTPASDAPPQFFVLFLQRPGGEDFRAVLFRLLAASAR
jgi:hypothetical protein